MSNNFPQKEKYPSKRIVNNKSKVNDIQKWPLQLKRKENSTHVKSFFLNKHSIFLLKRNIKKKRMYKKNA